MNNNTLLHEKEMIICSLCKEWKSASGFYFNKTHKRYLSQCKVCNNRRSQERRAKYRYENKNDYLKRRKEYNQATKGKRNKYRKRYYEENKQEEYMRYLRRRHKEKGLEVNFNESDWINCLDFFDESCAYCGTVSRLTKDHFIPVNKKGGLTVDNIVPACASCNCSKKDDDFLEWYLKQNFYSKERKTKIFDYLRLTGNKQKAST